jgi:tetraacyldisaccharide 4'-kinase
VVIQATIPADRALAAGRPTFTMRLAGSRLRNLMYPDEIGDLAGLRGQRVHAVAGIGNPQRFFDGLVEHGLAVTPHPFPDHHAYRPEDLDFGDDGAILMTEKDAVKCGDFARANWWALVVEAELEPGLDELVMKRLQRP